MNKNTFAKFGGIVVVVLVLGVMIAFATPFGSSIRDSVSTWGDNFTLIAKDATNIPYFV